MSVSQGSFIIPLIPQKTENGESNFLLLLCHFDLHVFVNAFTFGTGYASLLTLIRGGFGSTSFSLEWLFMLYPARVKCVCEMHNIYLCKEYLT